MSKESEERATATVLLTRLTNQRLPKAKALKAKVDRGECLDEGELAFLNTVFEDARQIQPLVERNPEYRSIYTQAASLYTEITKKALENAKSAEGR